MIIHATYVKLKKKYPEESSLDKCSEKTREQINFMTKTLKDFMNYFKPETEKQVFYLSSIFRRVEKIVAPSLKEKGIKLELSFCIR